MTKLLLAALLSFAAPASALTESLRCTGLTAGYLRGPQLLVDFSNDGIYSHKITLLEGSKQDVIAEVESAKDHTEEYFAKFPVYTNGKVGVLKYLSQALMDKSDGSGEKIMVRGVALEVKGQKPRVFFCSPR